MSLVACLGRDGYAEEALELYLRESVDVGGVRISNDRATGVGIILVDDQGNNEIVVDFGANLDLTPQLVMDQRESAALVVALCEGRNLTQAAAFAVRAAAQTVTKMGVVEAIPYRKDLE